MSEFDIDGVRKTNLAFINFEFEKLSKRNFKVRRVGVKSNQN